MTSEPTLIDYLKDKAAVAPDHRVFHFVDYDDEAQAWIQERHTFQEAWNKALEIAYMLRKKGCAPATARSSFPCRTSEPCMPCTDV